MSTCVSNIQPRNEAEEKLLLALQQLLNDARNRRVTGKARIEVMLADGGIYDKKMYLEYLVR